MGIHIPFRFGARPVGAWNLLVRVSPLSILACILGISALFLPWSKSYSIRIGSSVEATYSVQEFSPLTMFFHYGPWEMAMVYLIVIGCFAVLFTSLASGLIATGLIAFLDRIWSSLGTSCYLYPLAYMSLDLGFYVGLAACIVGAVSVIPRFSPSIKLKRELGESV